MSFNIFEMVVTFVFLKSSIANDNFLSIFSSPSYARLGESTRFTRQSSDAAFGNQHLIASLLVQYVRRYDHLQRGCLQ